MLKNKKYTSIDKINANKVKYNINHFFNIYFNKLSKSINYALKEKKFDEYYRDSLFKK